MILGNYTLWLGGKEPRWCRNCGKGPLVLVYKGLCIDCYEAINEESVNPRD